MTLVLDLFYLVKLCGDKCETKSYSSKLKHINFPAVKSMKCRAFTTWVENVSTPIGFCSHVQNDTTALTVGQLVGEFSTVE
jgi:hypothetical protein